MDIQHSEFKVPRRVRGKRRYGTVRYGTLIREVRVKLCKPPAVRICQALGTNLAQTRVSLIVNNCIKMAAVRLRNAAYAEEKAEVEVLSADAVKYGELAKKFRALQASLEGGGRTVRDAIGPVHSNTREHQIMIQSTFSDASGSISTDTYALQILIGSMPILTRCLNQARTKARRKGSSELGMSAP